MEIIEDDAEPAAEASRAKESETVFVQTEPEALQDEFCSNETFEEEAAGTFEKESDAVWVDKILVTADCQADWKDSYEIKLMDEKLNTLGIKMKSIIVNRNVGKWFESCLVTIELTRRSVIESETSSFCFLFFEVVFIFFIFF